jgi:hypothetical protein
MIKIPYKAPEQTPQDQRKASELTQRMKQLVATLSTAGQASSGKYVLLGAADRKRLKADGYPALLVDNVAFYTERLRLARDDGAGFVERDEVMVGFTSAAFDPDLYGSPAIKQAIVASHVGRCAFCETLIQHTAYGDVEHFRPKAAYTNSPSPAMMRPGYCLLAYDPSNLMYSCTLCNSAYKKNEFPILGKRSPPGTIENERPVLINPYTEDPRDFIRFNPMNGCAFPFDVAKAFYSATRGWGPPQIEQELWADPTLIPAQTNAQGQSISRPQVAKAFDDWMLTSRDPQLQRGIRTIGILGLNRGPLVRARVDHLRQLRGLFWTARGTGADATTAQQLLNTLMAAVPGSTVLTPQYVSATIDALRTWSTIGADANPWIEGYDSALQAFVAAPPAPVPTPFSDALCFLVHESEIRMAGRRRIVYVSSSDKTYGNPLPGGYFTLSIDWVEDIDNTVYRIKGGKVVEEMKLLDLLTRVNGNPAAYAMFRNSELWITGDYPPLKD